MKSIVIAHCSSWYHFLGILAYLNSRKEAHSEIHIIHEGFFQKKSQIPTSALSIFCEKLKIYNSVDELKKFILSATLDQKKIKLITTNTHPTKLLSITKNAHSLESIQIEEGIGSYGGFKQLVMARFRESKGFKSKVTSLIKTVIRETLITAHPRKTEPFLMFSKNGKTINYEVVSAYRDALILLSENTTCSYLNVSRLLISSPFSELGMIGTEEYIEKLGVHVGKTKDEVFIKSHPIEEKGKFQNLNIITDNISVELLALKNAHHLKEIYCFSSTAIYTCYLLLGIRPKRISALDLFYKNFSPAQKRILDKCCEII